MIATAFPTGQMFRSSLRVLTTRRLAQQRVTASPFHSARQAAASASPTPEAEYLSSKLSNVRLCTLNRPHALNALNLSLVRALYPKYKEWALEDNTSAIVLRGAGGKAFCAGGDVVAIYHAGKQGASADAGITHSFFSEEYCLDYRIATLPVPHVALLDGITMGGGVGLSVHGTYRIATEKTLFAMPETAIGFFCDVGGSHFLSRLPRHVGMYLALTGARLKAADCVTAGIATHFVPSAQLDDLVSALGDSRDSRQVESVLSRFAVPPAASGLEHEAAIERCFGGNSVADILSRLAAEHSPWADEALQSLSRASPTSLKVVFQQIRRGASLDLADCFRMEFRLSQALMKPEKSDFFEGVRALLVDKDKKPKWHAVSIDGVSDELVESFFQPLPSELELSLQGADISH